MPLLSIVAPVYNEEKNIKAFLDALKPCLEQVSQDYEIIFAMDPSTDRTEELILAAREKDPRVKLLLFSRRFGQPAATWAGLSYSSGEAVIVIDADLQDPPSLIPEMCRIWREEGYKVVIPQRRSRKGENPIKKMVAYLGYWFINKTASVEIPRNTGDFRLLDRRVVDELMGLKESHGFLRGLTAVVGFKTKLLPFDRDPRLKGAGKYNPLTGSLKIGFNGIVAFSGSLLRMMGGAGFLMAALSLLAAFLLFLLRYLNLYEFATGLATLGILLTFLTGCQLMSLGILGAYIGRIYEETKLRPKFIVDQAVGFDKAAAPQGEGGRTDA
ncbi:MAG: glycosyltransferase family 2 protein [Deltaproteobacteria bacterium]|jgi:dolichol-phosphate mannosyltransferase|nr:glycosyltransferase family 2 protein [Deltaproteobacteria bacterium]